MKRRTFVRRIAATAVACQLPAGMSALNPPPFSTPELMGKASIALFGEGGGLRKAAYEAFIALQKAAQAQGFAATVVSGYRSFYRQQYLWERKYRRYTQAQGLAPLAAIQQIIAYSTIPGTSRHHWGTEVDLIDGNAKTSGDVLLTEKFEAGGPFEGLKHWMEKNAARFGFYVVYTNDSQRQGFTYEPWHYSYAPLSIPMLAAYKKLPVFRLLQQDAFLGSAYITRDFIASYRQHHILDINPNLLP